MLSEVEGDLFDSGLPALAHGCNLQGVMGAGIAVEFRTQYPAMFDRYQALCAERKFHLGSVFPYRDPETGTYIFNLGTQPRPGRCASLLAIEFAIIEALDTAIQWKIPRIGLPRIGCGIGGLEWSDVRRSLENASRFSTTELVVYTLPEVKP